MTMSRSHDGWFSPLVTTITPTWYPNLCVLAWGSNDIFDAPGRWPRMPKRRKAITRKRRRRMRRAYRSMP